MQLTIHRGAKEIGGTCVELQSGRSRILIDFGLPLVDENMERFDSKQIKSKSKEDLITRGVLPDIKGLYEGEQPTVNAILLSHRSTHDTTTTQQKLNTRSAFSVSKKPGY